MTKIVGSLREGVYTYLPPEWFCTECTTELAFLIAIEKKRRKKWYEILLF